MDGLEKVHHFLSVVPFDFVLSRRLRKIEDAISFSWQLNLYFYQLPGWLPYILLSAFVENTK
jgi:hypothetical protein